MTSYPPRRSIFPHRHQESTSMTDEDVSSVGTDRASNHGVIRPTTTNQHALSSSPPPLDVPTTVVAINSAEDVISSEVVDSTLPLNDTISNEVKLTAEALALANEQRGMYNIGEASSNLSRSSSESGLKVSTHKTSGIPSQVKVIPSPIEEGNETPSHFVPWEAGSVASSLGDPLLNVPSVAVELKEEKQTASTSASLEETGLGPKALSELAMEVHNTSNLTSDTPPQANLSRDTTTNNNTTMPPLPSNYNIASTPIPSPTKIINNLIVSVDATIATTLPPAPSRSPMPASAIRTSSNTTSSGTSPMIHRNNGKKATFQQPMVLTRTSSNASSSTTATNAGRIKVRCRTHFLYNYLIRG